MSRQTWSAPPADKLVDSFQQLKAEREEQHTEFSSLATGGINVFPARFPFHCQESLDLSADSYFLCLGTLNLWECSFCSLPTTFSFKEKHKVGALQDWLVTPYLSAQQ
jgi:hypothetical protein